MLLLLISASTLKINAQIWFEDFPEGNGTTIDPQGRWTLSTPFGNNGTFSIENHSLVANDIFYGPAIFTSQSINISSYNRVYISLRVRETGVMDPVQDSISLYYRLDGGPEILWATEANDFDNNSQNWVTETVANISGSTLQIIVKMRNGDNDEHFYLDDVGVYSQPILYSIQSGDWNNNLTWSYTRAGASCGCQPNALTTAVVQTTNTVNINANVATAELVVENGGNVRWTAANFNLSLKNNGILNVKTGGILSRNGFAGANVVIDEEWKSGQMISDGTLSISSVLLSNYLGELTFSGTSSIDINQSVYINGDGTGFGNWYNRDPRITVTNNLGGSLNIGVNLGVAGGKSGNMTFNNNKTVNLTGIFANITTSSRFYNLSGATWNYGGLNFDTDIRLYANSNSNLFNYVRSGNQSIITPVDAYWNLTSSGAGTKTLSGNTTVNGNLIINSGTSLQLATRDFSVNGTTSISGTMLDNSSTGTDRFVGLVTINAGGIWDFSAGNDACEFRGGLTHNGASFSSGTGTYSFTTNTQTLSGSTNIRFDGAVTVTGVTLNNAKTTTIAGILVGTGTWNNNIGSTLNYENAAAPTVITITVNANPNTVNYSRSGNQAIRTTTYHHLIVSNSGNKSFGGTITVNGNLNIENSAVLQNSGSNDINLAGNWTDNNIADGFMEGTGELFFNGTTQQTITKTGGSIAENFYDLTLNNSSGLNLASGDLNITNKFSFVSGNIAFANSSYKVYLSAGTPGSLNYTSVTGSRIIGKFERGINTTGTYLFPVGIATKYNPANLVINAAPGAGSVLTEFISSAPGNSGLPITEGGVEVSDTYTDGYWSFIARNGFSDGNYNINLNGTGFSTAIFDITRIIKRTAGGNWGFDGTHTNASGSVCYRNNLTGGISPAGTHFGFGHTRPLITDQPDAQTLCENASLSFSIIATGYPALTYQWYKAPNTPLTEGGRFTGTNLSTISIANVVLGDAGNYYCIVTDGHGSTVQSTFVMLTVNALPATPTITAGGPTTFCTGSSVTLTSSAGSTYVWSTGATTASINVATAGSYTVRVTNISGCQSAVSVATIVTVNALPSTPTITAGGPTTFCAGGNVTLISSAGSTYLWSTGATTPSISVTTSGSYTVRVTNASGCQSAASAVTVVTVNALPATPTITADGPTTFCAGGSLNLTSGAGTSYLWSNTLTTASINVTTTGSYTVQVTNASGCQSAASAATVVTVNALPVTPTISDGGPTTFCAGGSVTLTSSAGTGYLWSNAVTTQSINVTASGSYSVQVSDASGCQSASSVATIVTVNALPVTPTITTGGPTTFCAGGSVTLTSSAETSYLWSNAETTQNINVTTTGSYTIQVTNASGCQSAVSTPTVVNVNSLPVVNAGTDATIPNGTSTTINATVTGTGPFTYSWSPSSQLVNALIEDPTTVNLSATTVFTLMATSTATSCSNTDAVTITISGGALSSTPTATPGTICAGANVQLDALASGGSGSYNYTWTSTPVGFTSSIANPTANPTVNTTYYVTVFDGFSTVNSQVAVTVNALPATPTITAGGPTTFCAGGSVTLTSSPGSTYLWSTGATTASINITTAGSYTVRIKNVSGCQSAASAAIAVTVNALPARPTIAAGGPKTFCASGSVILTSSAGASYIWSTGATTSSINVTTSGSYTVKVMNASGCQSAVSVAIVVTVNALPATPTIIADGPTTFCADNSVTLTSSAGSTYLWSTGASTASINVTTSGSYTVRVTNSSGCQSAASAATAVTVNALPVTPTITGGGPTTFCAGGSVTLTSSAGTSYLWSNAATTQSINVTASGSYSVQVTNASGCQSAASAATAVTVNAVPATPTITADGPTTFCAGGSVTLTSSAGSTYLWSTGAITVSINVTTVGSYTVKVMNASGCQSAVSVATVVTVNALPATPTIASGGPTTFCADSSVTLTSSTGASYLWSTGATTASINVTTTGSYTVKVMNASGCQSAASAATIVTVNALPATPTITAGGPTTLCAGGNVTLTLSGGTSYLWSTGATTASINVTTAGSYTVQVTNASGCQSAASAATAVIVNDLPATPILTAGGPTTFCAGGSVTLTSSAGTSYLWSNAATTSSINVTTAGSFTVKVMTASGCLSAASPATVVTVNVLPATPTITADGPTTFCAGDSITLTSSSGISYLWSNTATTESINVTASGSYTVKVMNVSGCQSAASVATAVTVNALPLVSITSSSSSMCVNDLRTLTGSPAGGTFTISDGPGTLTGNVLSATGIGNIKLEYIYTNVCANKATQSIIVNEKPFAIAGTDQELTFVFETQMKAELSLPETGEWSVISGSGHISDIHSPTTMVTELSIGENVFLWKVRIGDCEDNAEVKITVYDLFVPSVITPDGDGKNDFFKISENIGKVEMIIFNRWGIEEYTNDNYLNDWDGRNKKGVELPPDTYFYILKFQNGKIKKGSVLIKR